MKTRNINLLLAAEFSNPPMITNKLTPEYFINRIKAVLNKFASFGKPLGLVVGSDRKIGQLFTHRTYILNYGEKQLEFSLLHFHPAQRWEMKDFRLISD